MPTRPARRAPVLWVVIPGLFIVAAIAFLLVTGDRLARRYAPLQDAALEIKLEAALAHLWLEEFISGDRHEDEASIRQHLDRSAGYARSLLDGADRLAGLFRPQRDPVLRRELDEVLAEIAGFRALAEERLTARDGLGSAGDQQFDDVFEEFMKQADDVDAALRAAMAKSQNQCGVLQVFLIALCLLIAAVAGIVLRSYKRRQMRSTQALRRSEERLRLMADLVRNSSQPVGIGFPDGHLGQFNPAFCSLTGYSEEELRGLDWAADLTPPEWHSAERETLAELDRTGRPVRYEKEFIRKDGTRVPVEVFAHLTRGANGAPGYYYAFITDITERKQAEEKLQAGEKRFRALFEQAGDYCMILDPNTPDGIPVIVDANEAACRVHGYTREEFVGRPVADIDDSEGRRLCAERTRRIMTGNPFYAENTHVRRDGSTFAVAVHANRIDIDGEPPLIFTTEYDITELKRAREELSLEKNRLQFALEVSRMGAWDLNLIDHSSHRTLRHDQIFGYPSGLDEWTYEMFLEHVLPEERDEVNRQFTEASANQSDWNFECRIRRADGEIRWISAVGRHGDPVDGVVQVMGGVVADITERKQTEIELQKSYDLLEVRVQERTAELQTRREEAENLNRAMVNLLEDLKETNLGLESAQRELAETNRELEAFSYSVSHDLRAPLRHIDGFVSLLLTREGERLDSTSAHYLDTIAQSSGRMGRLIDALLNFSRTGRTQMRLHPVDSNEVVREVMDEIPPLGEGRRIVWEVADLPPVMADRSLLRLVWQNLIGNAIKYSASREEARIEIGATQEGCEEGTGEIAFFIRDNGVGFDPQYTHKLFGVFQRLHSEEEFEGTGIGLATVRRIVQRHGGRVWAEGAEGLGAAFYFTLRDAKGERDGDEADSAGR